MVTAEPLLFVNRIKVGRESFVKSGPEMDHYRRGYEGTDKESRRPILSFVRSIPVAGDPKEVVAIMDAGRTWIEASEAPTLFLSVEPGTMTPEDRDFVRTWKNVTEVAVQGKHMVTEDCPDDVGRAIAKWFQEGVLLQRAAAS